MRTLLFLLFGGIFLAMVAITGYATWDRGMWDAGRELVQFPWFVATLADAYFAFLTVYVWIAWREPTWTGRVVWFVLVICLGSIAISAYILRQLVQLRSRPLGELWQ